MTATAIAALFAWVIGPRWPSRADAAWRSPGRTSRAFPPAPVVCGAIACQRREPPDEFDMPFLRPPPDPLIGNAEKLSVFFQVKPSCPVRAVARRGGASSVPRGLKVAAPVSGGPEEGGYVSGRRG